MLIPNKYILSLERLSGSHRFHTFIVASLECSFISQNITLGSFEIGKLVSSSLVLHMDIV